MDSSLLQQVYRQYGREIYIYLYTLCRRHDMAEDLCQETFLKAILSLPNDHANVRAWLYRVARNCCLNALQKEKREDGELTEDMPDERSDLEETVLHGMRNRALYRALLQIDGVKREILLLHYFSGMAYRDIAALLGRSGENVRGLSHRAKKELKQYMEECGYDVQ